MLSQIIFDKLKEANPEKRVSCISRERDGETDFRICIDWPPFRRGHQLALVDFIGDLVEVRHAESMKDGWHDMGTELVASHKLAQFDPAELQRDLAAVGLAF